MTHKVVLILITILTQSVSQDIRTLELSLMNNIKYQCNDSDCSPSTIVSVPNIRRCQMVCIADATCRTVTFDHSSNNCQVFFDIPSENGNLLPQAGVATMITIDDRLLLGGK
jgi:hypothetical protein